MDCSAVPALLQLTKWSNSGLLLKSSPRRKILIANQYDLNHKQRFTSGRITDDVITAIEPFSGIILTVLDASLLFGQTGSQ